MSQEVRPGKVVKAGEPWEGHQPPKEQVCFSNIHIKSFQNESNTTMKTSREFQETAEAKPSPNSESCDLTNTYSRNSDLCFPGENTMVWTESNI